MDSSVSPKDEIWFLRMCHHISNAIYSRTGHRWQWGACALHAEYVRYTYRLWIRHTAFPLQQWLNEHASMLRYTYIAYLVTIASLSYYYHHFPTFASHTSHTHWHRLPQPQQQQITNDLWITYGPWSMVDYHLLTATTIHFVHGLATSLPQISRSDSYSYERLSSPWCNRL
jgi:hypothetical protein